MCVNNESLLSSDRGFAQLANRQESLEFLQGVRFLIVAYGMSTEVSAATPLMNKWNLSEDDDYNDSEAIVEEYVLEGGCYAK